MIIQLLKKYTGLKFVKEHKFHPVRRWRFDYANIKNKIAIEVEGGVWTKGRHTRGKGYISDMEKYNNAVLLGWRLLRFTPDQMNKIETYKLINNLLNDDPTNNNRELQKD